MRKNLRIEDFVSSIHEGEKKRKKKNRSYLIDQLVATAAHILKRYKIKAFLLITNSIRARYPI